MNRKVLFFNSQKIANIGILQAWKCEFLRFRLSVFRINCKKINRIKTIKTSFESLKIKNTTTSNKLVKKDNLKGRKISKQNVQAQI